MPLPPALRAKLLDRLSQLVTEGETVYGSITQTGEGVKYDHARYERWKYNVIAILENCLPPSHPLRDFQKSIGKHVNNHPKPGIRAEVARLTAIRGDFEHDLLGDLGAMIEAEVAADYMGQASGLLDEGVKGAFDHVPAAVLAGAVLENSLRTLCRRQPTPIPLDKTDARGNASKKTMMDLVEDLKKDGLYKETRASQLRSWVHIRNRAAHGEFTEFTRGQVEDMVGGIRNFLAEYM